MTKEEILKKLEALEKNPRISNLKYDSEILEGERDDSWWYGGFVLGFRVDDKYNITFSAIGDNVGSILLKNGDVLYYRDRSNSGYLGRLFQENGITKDSDYIVGNAPMEYQEPEMSAFKDNKNLKAIIYPDNCNWFEMYIEDGETGECTDDSVSSLKEVLEPDIDDFINTLQIACS